MKIRCFIGSSVALLLSASFAGADTLVVPDTLATVEGNDSNFGPFFNNSVRYQQVYSASQFPSSGPLLIIQIAFRPDGSVTDPTLFIRFDSVQIDLSTTSRTPSTLSTDFSSNVGADAMTVFNSFLFLNAPVTGPPGGPKDFSVVFDLIPFIYDPSAGDLLLDVRAFESGGGISAPFDAVSNNPFTAHVDAPSIGAPSGDVFSTGLVTQFQLTSVPEPGTFLLLGSLGALLIGVRARRRH